MTSRVLSAESLLKAGAAAGPVLGLDTGAPPLSVGIVADGRIVAAMARTGGSHAAELPGMIGELLASANLTIRELTAIAVALGPGSFTGLRIGLSYAKGLVLGTRCGLVGVPTLDAMALCAGTDGNRLVAPVLDARRGEVYGALYRPVGDALKKITGDLVIPLVAFTQLITGEVVFVGGAKAEQGRAIMVRRGIDAQVAGEAESAKGSFVAALGAARAANHDFDDAVTLEPRYVRASGASLNPP
ncbi:MAG: tRNA (adenosine(37)-N6)-threonylcarbamoyltransferase complex dimerization subunit type 1 TsaB [Candidatus Binataceae bacterium]